MTTTEQYVYFKERFNDELEEKTHYFVIHNYISLYLLFLRLWYLPTYPNEMALVKLFQL